jgi:DNA-binding GntR family transcriptional regulator
VPARSRPRLTEHAYEYTKGLLLDGALAPGSRVRVEDVVKALKASRQPVMEAFKRLAGEGFLEIIPQVGCRVVTPDPREIRDFFRLFAGAEALTAELAAARGDAAEREELRRIHGEIAELGESPDHPTNVAHAYRVLNQRFHGAVHAMAHSPLVASCAAGYWDRSDFYIATALGGGLVFARRMKEAHAEHASILAAIEGGEAKLAREMMERHILAFGRSSQRDLPDEDEATDDRERACSATSLR